MSVDEQGVLEAKVEEVVVEPSYDIVLLESDQIVLQMGSGGVLCGMVNGIEHNRLIATRAFPQTHPAGYISLSDGKGDELGVIRELAELTPESRSAVEQELRLRYLVPLVTRVDKLDAQPGLWVWDLQTDRGPVRLVMNNLHESVQMAGSGRLLLIDMDGRRCEVPSVGQLDAHSRKLLSRVL